MRKSSNVKEKSIADLSPSIFDIKMVKDGQVGVNVSNDKLTSLVGCPKIVSTNFWVDLNKLSSLYGSPEEVHGDFDASYNKHIKTLEGGPRVVHGTYYVGECGLTSLVGIPIKIGKSLNISYNPITSLHGIHFLKEMNGSLTVYGSSVVSHMLGVFMIKGISGITTTSGSSFGEAAGIVNRHISKGRAGLLPCQKELIEAGLADFAQI
jgi:hypothetical protein